MRLASPTRRKSGTETKAQDPRSSFRTRKTAVFTMIQMGSAHRRSAIAVGVRLSSKRIRNAAMPASAKIAGWIQKITNRGEAPNARRRPLMLSPDMMSPRRSNLGGLDYKGGRSGRGAHLIDDEELLVQRETA